MSSGNAMSQYTRLWKTYLLILFVYDFIHIRTHNTLDKYFDSLLIREASLFIGWWGQHTREAKIFGQSVNAGQKFLDLSWKVLKILDASRRVGHKFQTLNIFLQHWNSMWSDVCMDATQRGAKMFSLQGGPKSFWFSTFWNPWVKWRDT